MELPAKHAAWKAIGVVAAAACPFGEGLIRAAGSGTP